MFSRIDHIGVAVEAIEPALELYRDALRSDARYQQTVMREQALQGLLQDFAVRANNDPQLAQIFRKAQTANPAAPAAPRNPNQP